MAHEEIPATDPEGNALISRRGFLTGLWKGMQLERQGTPPQGDPEMKRGNGTTNFAAIHAEMLTNGPSYANSDKQGDAFQAAPGSALAIQSTPDLLYGQPAPQVPDTAIQSAEAPGRPGPQ